MKERKNASDARWRGGEVQELGPADIERKRGAKWLNV